MRAAGAVAGATLAAVLAGCIFVTGGTDGYSAATPTGVGCLTDQDCPGQACCLSVDSNEAPATSCQTTCGASWQHLCAAASECGDGGSCLGQTCKVEGGTVTIATCGPISICTQ